MPISPPPPATIWGSTSRFPGRTAPPTPIQIRIALLPVGAGAPSILRALMLSGLAASALLTFRSVVGDVETDIDDLVDAIQRWLQSTREVGFSKGPERPSREKRMVPLPLPLKPLRRGQSAQDVLEPLPEFESEPEGKKRTRRRQRRDEDQHFWYWLERRFGKARNINLREVSHGIQQF